MLKGVCCCGHSQACPSNTPATATPHATIYSATDALDAARDIRKHNQGTRNSCSMHTAATASRPWHDRSHPEATVPRTNGALATVGPRATECRWELCLHQKDSGPDPSVHLHAARFTGRFRGRSSPLFRIGGTKGCGSPGDLNSLGGGGTERQE